MGVYRTGSFRTRIVLYFRSFLNGFTKPTQKVLALLMTAMLAVGMTRSVRDLYRRYLSKEHPRRLNAYYNALAYAAEKKPHETMRSIAVQLMHMIPPELADCPIILATDDTLIEKFGKHFDHVKILFDHAAHDGCQYKNSHCFVTLMMAVPIRLNDDGTPEYLAVPLEHRMWEEDGDSKLQIAHDMVGDVLGSLEKAMSILVLCDSWYTKRPFTDVLKLDKRIDLLGAARSNTVLMQPDPPARTGKRGRPRKYGDRILLESIELKSDICEDYLVGLQEVRTCLFDDRKVTAIVTAPKDGGGSRRLYLSTCSGGQLARLMRMTADSGAQAAMYAYHFRWSIEVSYEVLKGFWNMQDYMVRTETGIVRLVNLISLAYVGMTLLPYTHSDFDHLRDMSPQDIRFEIGNRLRRAQFFDVLMRDLKNAKITRAALKTVEETVRRQDHAA